MFIKILTSDKFLHFIYMYVIQITFLLFFGLWSMLASIVFPLAKEFIYDKWMKKGQFEWLDFFASVIGGGIALFVYYMTYIRLL